MARVEVAEHAGACFGVERALRMVGEAAHAAEGPVHTLGPLIHNPVVVAELADAGVSVVTEPEEAAPGHTLFMRTHGVPPAVEDRARATGATVVDATCPFVKRVHKAAESLVGEGYQLVIVGEKGHPEVEGTLGHAPGALVVGSPQELEGAHLGRKVGVVVQTTLAEKTLASVVAALVATTDELRVLNTICAATNERQTASAALAARADVMVVIGGRNSANTTHLAEICREACPRTHHIELPEELDASWLIGAELVGITAGASTPASHIEAVRQRVEELLGEV